MRHLHLTAAGFMLAATLLNACSSPSSTSSAAASTDKAAIAASADVAVSKADSLNGIPHHAFGEQLNQFPGLEKLPTQAMEGMVLYNYPRGNKTATDWFGKHREEIGYVVYYFQDNKFIGLRVATPGPEPARRVLEEANFLFGPGTMQTNGGYAWPGKQVMVNTHPTYNFNGQGQQLDIFLIAALNKQKQQKDAKLKAENDAR